MGPTNWVIRPSPSQHIPLYGEAQQDSKLSKNFRLALFVDGEDLETKIGKIEKNLSSNLELVRVSDTYQVILHYNEVAVYGKGVTRETAEENARARSPIASEPRGIDIKLVRTYDVRKREHPGPTDDTTSGRVVGFR